MQRYNGLKIRKEGGGSMAVIVRIVIKGSSGYCCFDDAFNDKVTLTQDSISYEYIPCVESKMNPKRKWSYKTNSPLFKMRYKEIASMVSDTIEEEVLELCTDIGGIEFNITYSDKTKFKETYWVSSDYFRELFAVIKSLVPASEETPVVLMTSEDYEDGEEE